MPKKARKSNVAREIRSAGNRSEAFARGQRRVSTPRGRSSNLTLYAQQSQQQVAGAQRREAMDEFYQQRAQESQAQEQAQREREAQVRATALAESQARELTRQGARAQVRGIRERQSQQKATEQQALSNRLGRAQARVSANLQRRQGLQLARQQQQLQVQQQQAQLHQQRQQHNEALAQQRQIQSRKAEAREQVSQQQLALQREGMSRQDRLIDAHFSQMRGMFMEAQQGQERRLGEIEGKMNEGLRQLQNQRQQPIDITYLNRASGRELDHSSLAPPPSNTGLNRPQLQLKRADTTDSEASQLADEILGRGTTSDRRGKERQVSTPAFQEARQSLAKTLTEGDYKNVGIQYDAELRRQERVDRRNKAKALARRQDLIQDAPTPEQLDRRKNFIQQGEPLSLVPQSSDASTIPFVDSSSSSSSDDGDDDLVVNYQGKTFKLGDIKASTSYFDEPEPELDLEIVPLNVSQTNVNPISLSENISAGVGQAGQLVGEGISSGLRAGAGVVGGIATGLGEAVYNQLPQPRDVGLALGEGAIAGGKAVGQGAIAGIGALAQAGAGAVSDLLEVSSDEDAPQVISTGKPQPLLQNVNPLEVITGRFTSGSDRDGWRPTRYKLTDNDGVIGKKVKGKVYYVMKKDGRNVSIVDITNPKLTKWNNVGVGKFDKLIKAGQISL
tara:strand:- start:3416 stop:5437 length:2022 start_codon:yes stop_codon:yes gene_type:complete